MIDDEILKRYPILGRIDPSAPIDEHRATVRFYEMALEYARRGDESTAYALARMVNREVLTSASNVAMALVQALPTGSDDRIVAEVEALVRPAASPAGAPVCGDYCPNEDCGRCRGCGYCRCPR
jgi:hypothetical protein